MIIRPDVNLLNGGLKKRTYTIFLDDIEKERNEEWILELKRSFSEAMEQYTQYANTKAAKDIPAKQVYRQELTKFDFGKTRRMIDQAFIKQTRLSVFKTLVDEAVHFPDSPGPGEDVDPALRKVHKALETSLADYKAEDAGAENQNKERKRERCMGQRSISVLHYEQQG